LTEYWTDFEAENGFEDVLPLATILVQDFIAQRYSFTPERPIHTKSQSPDNRPTDPLDILLDRFESENGFVKVLQLPTEVIHVAIE
jgi:hypothetical protein